MGLREANFYRRSEELINDTITGVIIVDEAINPYGIVRVIGDSSVEIVGEFEGETVVETVSKTSSYSYDYISTITPTEVSFTGIIKMVDEGGSPIPIDRFLFSTLVNIAFPFLKKTSSIRDQQEIGVMSVNELVIMTASHPRFSELKITDYVIVEEVRYLIRVLKKITANHWIIHAVMDDAT